MGRKNVKVTVLGATGAVGRVMVGVLAERGFPSDGLKLLGGPSSAGSVMRSAFGEHRVEAVSEEAFNGADIVLGAVSSELSRKYAPAIKSCGAVFIDNSSAFRLDEGVPLVVPEINPGDVMAHSGVIANPNCSTIILLMALYAINAHSRITRIIASTYQAVSGAGKGGIDELRGQTDDFAAGRALDVSAFKHQIFDNLIPHIDEALANGYTKEEMKLSSESRKILHSPELRVSATCVRVPVSRSHSISMTIETEKPISPGKARELIAQSRGVKLCDDLSAGLYPMPILSSNQDDVLVGRIREDISGGGLCLWCSGDQLRKGAATNAVQIAELLLLNF
jgi:aspartate-semialdehyde dehydrogenase